MANVLLVPWALFNWFKNEDSNSLEKESKNLPELSEKSSSCLWCDSELVWHLNPFSSRHCFSHIWQYQRSFWSPLDLILFEIHFGVPNSAFPILIILCFYSLITGVLKKFSFSKRFFINYLRIWKFHDENFRFVIFLWFSTKVFTSFHFLLLFCNCKSDTTYWNKSRQLL